MPQWIHYLYHDLMKCNGKIVMCEGRLRWWFSSDGLGIYLRRDSEEDQFVAKYYIGDK